ncbi:DNA-binding protein [Nitrincola sp.]|uniref:DNA-binding protein n=1 Tax=Nitrincola sp. TaxID=1926584 RepID=UPI003A8C8F9C
MARSSNTHQSVFKAADTLLEQGIRPTQQNVRELIGTGSITTINRALGEWWGTLSERLNRRQAHPELPEPVLKLASQTWDRALAYAEKRFHEQAAQYTDKISVLEQALKQAEQGGGHALSLLQQEHQTLLQRHASLLEEFRQHSQDYRELEEKLFRTSARLDAAERELLHASQISPGKPQNDEVIEYRVKIRIQEEEIARLKKQNTDLQSDNAGLRRQLNEAEKQALEQRHQMELIKARYSV